MKRYALVVALALFALAGCLPPAAAPTPTSEPTPTPRPAPTELPVASASPAEVVTNTAERFSAGDLAGGLAYWADDAIWYIIGLPPNGFELLQGKDAIRAEFENEIAAHLTWEVAIQSVVGAQVYSRDTTWLDFTRQIGVAPVEAIGQYLVEDGKIATYAWTIVPESLAKLKAALAELQAEPAAQPEAVAPAPAPVTALTVTIADGTCRMAEPVTLKAGDVQLTVDVKDEDRQGYAVVFLTMDEGKDFMDLMAASVGYPPAWADALHYEEIGPAASKTYTIRASAGRPLYGICFSKPPDHPIGNLGPLEVGP